MTANAITYEEAFDSIKAIPNMKGVEGTEISSRNVLAQLALQTANYLFGLEKKVAQRPKHMGLSYIK